MRAHCMTSDGVLFSIGMDMDRMWSGKAMLAFGYAIITADYVDTRLSLSIALVGG